VRLTVAGSETPGPVRPRPRFLAAIPVYDEAKGTVFGLVVIETDAAAGAEQILDRHIGGRAEILITDGHGQVWVSSQPGRGVKVETAATNVATVVPGAAEFFNRDTTDLTLVLPESGVIANRVRPASFDPGSSIGVVLRLVD
jgi:hypothetical protein